MLKVTQHLFVFSLLFLGFVQCTSNTAQNNTSATTENTLDTRIIHTVIFSLKHEAGSPEERQFLDDARTILTAIPGVEEFEVRKQVSQKNEYQFGFSMKFADQQAYDKYNQHPEHIAFVEKRWKKEVTDFLEIDYEQMNLQ
ncbi:Dabb family protein [Rapidithrix thailandica]|uniref:Dabb family protein n=1 Tax=Rapidithrix thailandica TaxID=413964 RepID=A0AAW9S4L0_9BACT